MGTIGYARLAMQESSLLLQVEKLKAFPCDIVYEDDAHQKNLGNSKVLHNLCQHLNYGDTLVVTSLSRLGKNTRQLSEVTALLKEKHGNLVSLKENIDTREDNDLICFDFLNHIARMESELVRERTLLGLQEARKVGKIGGRPKVSPKTIAKIRHLFHDENLPTQVVAAKTGVSLGSVYKYAKLTEEEVEKIYM